MGLNSSEQALVRYWRNSLVDAQNCVSGFNEKEASQFKKPLLACLENGEFGEKLAKELFRQAQAKDEDERISVALYPYVFRAVADHGVADTSSKPSIVAPLVIWGSMDRLGFVYITEKLAVGRDILEPAVGDGFTIGSVQQVDEFFTRTRIPEPSQSNSEEGEAVSSPRAARWRAVLEYGQTLLSDMPSWAQLADESGAYRRVDYFFVQALEQGPVNYSRGVVELYDDLMRSNVSLPLLGAYSTLLKPAVTQCVDTCSVFAHHVGHASDKYPLAAAQRDAIAHLLLAKDGEILPVNGPPGTGKTTMLLSVVATLWVQAALDEAMPPVVVAASTNNQAVTNIIDAFGKDFGTGTGAFAGRWLPDISSYGAYFSSQSKKAAAADRYQTQDFFDRVESTEYLEQAESAYLSKGKAAFPTVGAGVLAIVRALHNEMKACQRRLLCIESSWHARQQAIDSLSHWRVRYPDIASNPHDAKQRLERYKVATDQVEAHQGRESVWLCLLGFVPAIRRKRVLQHLLAISDVDIRNEVRLQVTNPDEIPLLLAQRYQRIRERLTEYEQLIKHVDRSNQEWSSQIEPYVVDNEQPESLTLSDIDGRLDTSLRFLQFVLAAHYWEGRWLLSMRETGNHTEENKKRRGKDITMERWYQRMMLTPCVVSTFYTLPGHMAARRYAQGDYQNDYLFNFIDLLVVDEAGQVLPEVAGASFALAKKALVVGDTDQIEPIWSVPQTVDLGNLIDVGLLPSDFSESDLMNLAQTGKLASSGSVMALAQQVTRYHQHPKLQRGLYLVEHRRCFDEIISFCNDLCYEGLLQPLRGTLDSDNADRVSKGKTPNRLPALGYLNIKGQSQESGAGSRVNRVEANAIAVWIAEHRSELEAFYERPIHKIVGVVTPFSAQKREICKQLGLHNINAGNGDNSLTVGTIHALQGAERPVVIFSPTYSRTADGSFIDGKKSMLNVAVSRAKDSFLVIGDMGVFNPQLNTPRGKLAARLFANQDNNLEQMALHVQSV